jgi:SAM-dependent methyltransferase
MNRLHNWYCNRDQWKDHVREELVPPALEGVELGDDVLEVGPGFGPATEVLAARDSRTTAIEIDPALAARLRERLPASVEIVDGDATAMPFDDGRFSAAVCFTMLHHVPSEDAQDRLFAEVRRVLRPGGVFTGTDSVGKGIGFALLHIGDIKVLIDPADFPRRLERAGFERVEVRSDGETTWFRAAAPAEPAGPAR